MKNFVLCLSLFCIFCVSFAARDRNILRRTFAVDFSDINENDLKGLEPKVTTAFQQLSSVNNDFDVSLKRIVSGVSQAVAGKRYQLIVEAVPKNNANNVKKCDANILENSNGELVEIQVKCEDKEKVYIYYKS